MLLIRQIPDFSVIKLDPHGPIPGLPESSDFWTISRSPDELSLVCPTTSAPHRGIISRQDDWTAFRVAGTMEFTLTGIVASISAPLAAAKLGIFVISTFDTDYILVSKFHEEHAIAIWRDAGIDVTTPVFQSSRLHFCDLRNEQAAVFSNARANTTWVPDYPTEGDFLVAGMLAESPAESEPVQFQIRLRSSGEAIGGIGFKGEHTHGDFHGIEIGYGIAPSMQKIGYASESVGAIIDFARTRGITHLCAETEPGHQASQKVLQRNGFSELERTDSAIWWKLAVSDF